MVLVLALVEVDMTLVIFVSAGPVEWWCESSIPAKVQMGW